MERELFDWDGWDDLDIACLQFYNVKLKKQIGDFLPGEAFDFAVVDFKNSKLQLGRNNTKGETDSFYEFEIGLTVKGQI